MATIDPNIPLQTRQLQIESPVNQLAKVLGIQSMQDRRRAAQSQFAAQERALDDQNRLRSLLGANVPGETRAQQAARIRAAGFLKEAADLEKSDLEARKGEADIGKTGADTDKTRNDIVDTTLKRYRGALDYIDTPQGAVRWLQAQYADPVIGAQMARLGGPVEQAITRIPTDPQGFQQWRQQAAMGMEKYIQQAEVARHNRAGEGIQAGQLRVAQDRLAFDREAPRGVPLETSQGPMLVDPRTASARPITVGGAALPSKEAGARAAKAPQILTIVEQAEPLIDKATGSGVGAARDYAGALVGRSGEGADALAQLKVLQAQLMLAQPRMEGPQSDRDVQLYREAAASLGDPMVPSSQKKAALKLIRDLNQRYSGAAPANAAASAPSVSAMPGVNLPAGWSITPVN